MCRTKTQMEADSRNVQNFENVQDEFKEILDRPETSAPSEQTEPEDQKQEGSSETASAQPETGLGFMYQN